MCFMFHSKVFNDVMTFDISEKLKFDCLKNKNSFRSEIKSILPCYLVELDQDVYDFQTFELEIG